MATTTRRTFTWRNGIGRTTSRSSPSTPQAADTPAAAHGATAAADGSLAAAAGDSSAAAGNAPGAHGLPERPNVPHGDPPGSPPEDPFGDGDPWQSLRTPPRTPAPLPPPSPAPSASGSKKYVDYKMDPAPVWGGDMPEKNYKEYYRNLQLWLVEAEARLPSNLIGKRIIDSIPLGSKLSSMLAHLSVPEICADNGHKVILKIIEDAHEYLKDQGLERAFDEAIFKGRRERGQSLTTFLSAKKAAFAELKKQGLDLLETRAGRHLLGHLILRQGSFNQDQRQRLKVVTNGSIDYKDIEIAVQKIFGDKLEEPHQHEPGARRWRSATFWDEEAPDDLDDDDYDGQMADADEQEDQLDILEDLIALNENDEVQLVFFEELPMIMEESDALEALGHNLEDVFYETRERLHQKGKGKSKGKKGKGKSSGKTFMAGKGKGGYLQHRKMLQASRTARGYDHPWQHRQGSRLTLTELKSRTRCHQCKQVGHWSKECPQRSKPPASLRSAPASTSSLSGMSTGFFMQPPKEDGEPDDLRGRAICWAVLWSRCMVVFEFCLLSYKAVWWYSFGWYSCSTWLGWYWGFEIAWEVVAREVWVVDSMVKRVWWFGSWSLRQRGKDPGCLCSNWYWWEVWSSTSSSGPRWYSFPLASILPHWLACGDWHEELHDHVHEVGCETNYDSFGYWSCCSFHHWVWQVGISCADDLRIFLQPSLVFRDCARLVKDQHLVCRRCRSHGSGGGALCCGSLSPVPCKPGRWLWRHPEHHSCALLDNWPIAGSDTRRKPCDSIKKSFVSLPRLRRVQHHLQEGLWLWEKGDWGHWQSFRVMANIWCLSWKHPHIALTRRPPMIPIAMWAIRDAPAVDKNRWCHWSQSRTCTIGTRLWPSWNPTTRLSRTRWRLRRRARLHRAQPRVLRRQCKPCSRKDGQDPQRCSQCQEWWTWCRQFPRARRSSSTSETRRWGTRSVHTFRIAIGAKWDRWLFTYISQPESCCGSAIISHVHCFWVTWRRSCRWQRMWSCAHDVRPMAWHRWRRKVSACSCACPRRASWSWRQRGSDRSLPTSSRPSMWIELIPRSTGCWEVPPWDIEWLVERQTRYCLMAGREPPAACEVLWCGCEQHLLCEWLWQRSLRQSPSHDSGRCGSATGSHSTRTWLVECCQCDHSPRWSLQIR